MRGSDTRRGRLPAWAGAVALALAAAGARGETITLRWRHPAPERVAGFRVHTGPAPGQYTQTLDVGRPTPDAEGVFRAEVEVADGAPTHLAVSAYGAEGEQSPRSNDWERAPSRPAPGRPGRPQVVEP